MADADLIMRADRMKVVARIRDLENELAEARAQIAAKGNVPPVLDDIIGSLEDQLTKTEDQLREARAQIAAKDAALRAAITVVEENDVLTILYAALTRETE